MQAKLTSITRDEFASRLQIAPVQSNSEAIAGPSPWGIAEAIRREVRCRSVLTRRELKNALVPILQTAGYSEEAWSAIRKVAEDMVLVGELIEIRCDHQRGYAAMPSRWVRLGANQAAILGVVDTKKLNLAIKHPLQFVRRFDCNDIAMIQTLAEQKTLEEDYPSWIGRPDWQTRGFCKSDECPESLSVLWAWQLNQLERFGDRFELAESSIVAVEPSPGNFFGSCSKSDGRWRPVRDLPNGTYLAAQPGHTEMHWRPSFVSLSDGIGHSILLDSGDKETWEYFNWLLLARSVAEGYNELVLATEDSDQVQVTWPAPQQFRRLLCLIGEDIGKWRYHVHACADFKGLIDMSFEGISVQ